MGKTFKSLIWAGAELIALPAAVVLSVVTDTDNANKLMDDLKENLNTVHEERRTRKNCESCDKCGS